jgi:NADPH:quinone reductase-like Zn-dependent oxidoreductase
VQSLDISAFGNGAVLDCDFVGTVEKLGELVTTVKVEDRIAGLIWGGTRQPHPSITDPNILTSLRR